jgi:hypothetical protein
MDTDVESRFTVDIAFAAPTDYSETPWSVILASHRFLPDADACKHLGGGGVCRIA